jgi:hypothetical protein
MSAHEYANPVVAEVKTAICDDRICIEEIDPRWDWLSITEHILNITLKTKEKRAITTLVIPICFTVARQTAVPARANRINITEPRTMT